MILILDKVQIKIKNEIIHYVVELIQIKNQLEIMAQDKHPSNKILIKK